MSTKSEQTVGGGVKERRRSTRETLLVHAINARVSTNSGQSIQGTVKDLSADGARIKGDPKDIKVGDVIQVTFIFPLNHKVEYRSIVRHIDPGDSFGIEFVM